jgi:hypothetical protein
MIIVRWEEGDLRWATVKRRLRLNTPREAVLVDGAVTPRGRFGGTGAQHADRRRLGVPQFAETSSC